MLKTPPGPKGYPFIGNVFDFATDPLAFLQRVARDYGDISNFRLLDQNVYFLTHPDFIHSVLVEQADKVRKGDLDHAIMSLPLGNGLLINEGASWKQQRKQLQPVFHAKRIEAYFETMIQYTNRMLEGWHDGKALCIHQSMTELTMQIVSKTLYDADVNEGADTIGAAIEYINGIGGRQIRWRFMPPHWMPFPALIKVRAAIKQLDTLLMGIIEERRTSDDDTGDLLSMLLLAQDDEGVCMTDRQVRDEVVTLFIAGHETTSNALTWAWVLLAQHPAVEAKLHAELDAVLGGAPPTMADLKRLPYLDMVLKEAMRLYPPAWSLNTRQPTEDIVVGGSTIPKGSLIFIVPYISHRDPRYFDQPEAFIPERWTPEFEKALPRYAYFPFGGGPRVCIGNSFALMEARLIVATIAGRYRLALAPDAHIEIDPVVTLRPRGSVPMNLRLRTPMPQPTTGVL
ncbi:MAG: cytochrome P450 [Chloroflexota bacterium]|nr:cytochrome P450 [Chloroflexota bacterium]